VFEGNGGDMKNKDVRAHLAPIISGKCVLKPLVNIEIEQAA